MPDLTSTLANHYADGDVGNLELRLVSVATGVAASGFDWSALGIVQVTPSVDGPPWLYSATRDIASLAAGTYIPEWRRVSDGGGPWIDDDVTVGAEPTVTEGVELFRLLLDDVDGELFTTQQVQAFLDQNPSDLRLAVAAAADILAVRLAGGIKKFTTDGQTFERGSRSEWYAELAKRMRADAGLAAALVEGVPSYNVVVDLTDFGVTLSGSQLPERYWTP